MPQFAMADSFVDAFAALDAASTKRVAAFLGKLVREPDARSLHPEIVRDAPDRSIRSLRVTDDLRAIARIAEDTLLLLFVGEHDRAYRWARDHCVECHPVTGELQLVAAPEPASRQLAARTAVREAVRIAHGVATSTAPGPFDALSDDDLLALGVPPAWLPTLRLVQSDDMFLEIADELPSDVADRLARAAAGEPSEAAEVSGSAAADPGWLCTVEDGHTLCRVLDAAGIDHGLDA